MELSLTGVTTDELKQIETIFTDKDTNGTKLIELDDVRGGFGDEPDPLYRIFYLKSVKLEPLPNVDPLESQPKNFTFKITIHLHDSFPHNDFIPNPDDLLKATIAIMKCLKRCKRK